MVFSQTTKSSYELTLCVLDYFENRFFLTRLLSILKKSFWRSSLGQIQFLINCYELKKWFSNRNPDDVVNKFRAFLLLNYLISSKRNVKTFIYSIMSLLFSYCNHKHEDKKRRKALIYSLSKALFYFSSGFN